MEAAIAVAPNRIREAKTGDIPSIVRLGKLALEEDPIPRTIISTEKLKATAWECVHHTTNYAWVAEVDGEVQGAVCALLHQQQVYERMQASVVQFYCTAPGWGAKLIDHFLEWCQKPKIKCIAFTLEGNADPRIAKLLERKGFVESMPVYTIWR